CLHPGGVGEDMELCIESTTTTLSDEYTTAELISPDGLEYPVTWGDGWGGPASAATSISGDEKAATATKMKYRLKFIAPKGQRFNFQYYEVYQPEGGIATNEVKGASGTGTGEIQYY